jgi:hypothetical protein
VDVDKKFDTADLTWDAVKNPVDIQHIVVFEDGPQPRDDKGRFRPRKVIALEPEKSDG